MVLTVRSTVTAARALASPSNWTHQHVAWRAHAPMQSSRLLLWLVGCSPWWGLEYEWSRRWWIQESIPQRELRQWCESENSKHYMIKKQIWAVKERRDSCGRVQAMRTKKRGLAVLIDGGTIALMPSDKERCSSRGGKWKEQSGGRRGCEGRWMDESGVEQRKGEKTPPR